MIGVFLVFLPYVHASGLLEGRFINAELSRMHGESQKLTFQPKARIIRTIGDQLISGLEAAIIELVKNPYDADASYVSIKFFPPLIEGECRIEVSDDGHGMTLEV